MIRPNCLAALLACAFALAGCASPSLPMLGAAREEILVGGQRYAVWHTTQRAESVRLSAETGMTLTRNLAASKVAIETASGCAVRDASLYGDRVMAEALLLCPGAAQAQVQPQQTWGGLAQAARP